MALVLQFAMLGEAEPFLARGTYRRLPGDPAYPFQFWEGRTALEQPLVVGVAGAHPRFQVDAIGSVPAALLTHALITRFKPRRLVNAGTAGGFQARGARIGDVYLGADAVVFHDRRIPLEGFEAMGRGHFPVSVDRQLAASLGLKVGVVSTGDSLDASATDLQQLAALDASVKEMEAAGIGWVAEHHRVPLVLLKAITDFVDHDADTSAQFLANYRLAVANLCDALERLLPHL